MDTQTVTQVQQAVQHPHGNTNPDSQLNPAAKRLLLSAHLGPIFKKLRRGLCVEESEIRRLLAFSVPDGWQPETEARQESDDYSDVDWSRRLAQALR